LQPFCTFFPTEPPTTTTGTVRAAPPPHPHDGLPDDHLRAGLTRTHESNPYHPPAAHRAPVPASEKANLKL